MYTMNVRTPNTSGNTVFTTKSILWFPVNIEAMKHMFRFNIGKPHSLAVYFLCCFSLL